ncbi:MAG: hypothetical protein ACKVUS_14515 [Saprospiraceae bacterium]
MVSQLNAFDEIANLMVAGMNAEWLISYEIPPKMLKRYQFLTSKLKSDALSVEENNELLSLLMINQVISLAKVRARRKLAAA